MDLFGLAGWMATGVITVIGLIQAAVATAPASPPPDLAAPPAIEREAEPLDSPVL